MLDQRRATSITKSLQLIPINSDFKMRFQAPYALVLLTLGAPGIFAAVIDHAAPLEIGESFSDHVGTPEDSTNLVKRGGDGVSHHEASSASEATIPG